MSEWYARDTSRKIKAVLHNKGNNGKHMTNTALYGYRKSHDDNNQWTIDEEAASVVRRIFQMTINGKGPYQIARTLTDEKVTRPSVYIAVRDGIADMPPSASEPHTWGGASVRSIIARPEYMGCTVNFRTYKDSYEDKVIGALSPKRFEILSHEYENEQEDMERQIAALRTDLERFDEDSERADKFIGIVRRYTDFTELTPAMLNEFVEKILVHETVGVGYRRTQKVEIFLNFIGQFDVPGYEEPEPEPIDPVDRQRAIWRANYYKYRDKIMAVNAEKAARKKAARVAAMPVKTPEEIEAEKEAKRQRKLGYHRNYQREWQRGRKEKIDKVAHEKVI
jgi:hypothetical protein